MKRVISYYVAMTILLTLFTACQQENLTLISRFSWRKDEVGDVEISNLSVAIFLGI